MSSPEKARWFSLSPTILVVLAFAVLCAAQTSRVAGAIQGTVVDPTGSAIAGATVSLRNLGTNLTRTISTNPEGSFRAGELPVVSTSFARRHRVSPNTSTTRLSSLLGGRFGSQLSLFPQRSINRSPFRRNRRRLTPARPQKRPQSAMSELKSRPWSAVTTSTSFFWLPN
jgi:hypothetical protein